MPAGGIACLQRTRAQVAELRDALKRRGVVLRKTGGDRESEGRRSAARHAANDALAYLRLVCRPDDDPSFEDALRVPPRAGFGNAGAGLTYLRTYARSAAPGGGPVGLLRAAQVASSLPRAKPTSSIPPPPPVAATVSTPWLQLRPSASPPSPVSPMCSTPRAWSSASTAVPPSSPPHYAAPSPTTCPTPTLGTDASTA